MKASFFSKGISIYNKVANSLQAKAKSLAMQTKPVAKQETSYGIKYAGELKQDVFTPTPVLEKAVEVLPKTKTLEFVKDGGRVLLQDANGKELVSLGLFSRGDKALYIHSFGAKEKGQGYGKKIIDELKQRYPDCDLTLNAQWCDLVPPHKFYLDNGFVPKDKEINEKLQKWINNGCNILEFPIEANYCEMVYKAGGGNKGTGVGPDINKIMNETVSGFVEFMEKPTKSRNRLSSQKAIDVIEDAAKRINISSNNFATMHLDLYSTLQSTGKKHVATKEIKALEKATGLTEVELLKELDNLEGVSLRLGYITLGNVKAKSTLLDSRYEELYKIEIPGVKPLVLKRYPEYTRNLFSSNGSYKETALQKKMYDDGVGDIPALIASSPENGWRLSEYIDSTYKKRKGISLDDYLNRNSLNMQTNHSDSFSYDEKGSLVLLDFSSIFPPRNAKVDVLETYLQHLMYPREW